MARLAPAAKGASCQRRDLRRAERQSKTGLFPVFPEFSEENIRDPICKVSGGGSLGPGSLRARDDKTV